MFKVFRRTASVLLVMLLAGCHNSEYYRQQRVAKARKHFNNINKRTLDPKKVFTLNECIEVALKHNLSLKVFDLKEQIASEKVTARMLGMLPELNVDNQLRARNRTPGARSQSIATGEQSLVSSRSIDNTVNDIKIELALSTLDFGLAFLNSLQAEDQRLIALEQKKRAAQNLIFDVVRTYFKVAACQDAIDTAEQLLVKCRKLEKVFVELNDSKALSPFRLLDERKRFIRLEKRLMAYRRSYEDSCIELRSLMGFAPREKIRVDTSWLKELHVATLPSIKVMERIALTERPELYELDFESDVLVNEARKTILTMFPAAKLFLDFTNSDNSYLYTQSWSSVGIHAAYNLLRLPQRIARYRATNAEIDEISMRTLALSIGIMAQVRIAHANIQEVKQRYELDDRTFQAYKKSLQAASQSYQSGTSLSRLELDRLELETAETYMDRLISISNYYVAYYRLLNTIGIKDLAPETVERVITEIEMVEQKQKSKAADTTNKFNPQKAVPEDNNKPAGNKKTVNQELKEVIPELVQR
ncbi:MAG: TolC family protein [Victivallales bacterium]|nr:TolC family protein [Victivallales bacterium]